MGCLFCFCDIVFDNLAKVCRKGKNEVIQNGGVCVHRLGFLGKGQAHKPIKHFDNFEQLYPVGGCVHGNEYVRQTIYRFHIAARRYPYHFRERLRDCPGDKVYLVLADFTALRYNTFVNKRFVH